MKKLYVMSLLIFTSAMVTSVHADDASTAGPAPTDASLVAAAPQPVTDPTLAFFMALSNCTPGTYTEKNNLSAEVGQTMLKQQIAGPSDDNQSCNATLTTPDNRSLTCSFPNYVLPQVSDQRFLEGILDSGSEDSDQNSVNSDLTWSKLKASYCGLDQ